MDSDFDARGPFLRRTAIAAGVTPKQLRGPACRCVLPGAYVAAATVTTPARARASRTVAVRRRRLGEPRLGGAGVRPADPDHRDGARVRPARRCGDAIFRRDVDSPMETRLRMLIVLAGLPEPQVNLKVSDVDGDLLRTYDLACPAVRVAAGASCPVISSGVFSTPEQTLCRIHRVLLARGLPGVPRRLGDGWRAHFPGHTDAA